MITLDNKFIANNGGYLKALSLKCSGYMHKLLTKYEAIKINTIDLKKLDRTILHTSPHLDEYFADLLLRACLPPKKQNIDFMELSVHSLENDSNCKAYFPNAIVLGIGAKSAGRVKAIRVFDEHLEYGLRDDASCSQMVVNDLLQSKKIPLSITSLLREVNEIDSMGGAYDQHVGNIIKAAHNTRFFFDQKEDDSIQGKLSPEWKKTLMDASITSIVFCIEKDIDVISNPKLKSQYIKTSLAYFLEHCGFEKDKYFESVSNRMKSLYNGQKPHFENALLPKSKNIGQLLILGRICFSLGQCFGEHHANIIMMHFWEMIYLNQHSFHFVKTELSAIKLEKINNRFLIKNSFGNFELFKLPSREIIPSEPKRHHSKDNLKNLLFFYVEPYANLILYNRPISSSLNNLNDGFGISFFYDSHNGTKSIFKGSRFPYEYWRQLVEILICHEPECWYSPVSPDTSRYAHFAVNGNDAHQYVPLSQFSGEHIFTILEELTKRKPLQTS